MIVQLNAKEIREAIKQYVANQVGLEVTRVDVHQRDYAVVKVSPTE